MEVETFRRREPIARTLCGRAFYVRTPEAPVSEIGWELSAILFPVCARNGFRHSCPAHHKETRQKDSAAEPCALKATSIFTVRAVFLMRVYTASDIMDYRRDRMRPFSLLKINPRNVHGRKSTKQSFSLPHTRAYFLHQSYGSRIPLGYLLTAPVYLLPRTDHG